MTKKVLILGVASVQMDAILKLNDLGYETHAVAMKKDGPGAEVADYFEEINILDEEKIIDYINDKNIDVVYSVGSDLAMPIASKISENLGLPYFVSGETARICNKKDLMRSKLGKGFKGNLDFQILETGKETIELEFPFIMKPTDSQGQRGVNLISNIEELQSLFNETKNYSRAGLVIIEQYIDGPEVSVNGYMVDGELIFLEVSDRETWSKYTGLIKKHVVPSEKITSEQKIELVNIIESSCNKIGITNGPVYVQMKIENHKPYIIEITPRLDGCHMWKLLKYATDFDLLTVTFEHLIEGLYPEMTLDTNVNSMELEFFCQEPSTRAKLKENEELVSKSIDSFMYYDEDDLIRPVNGKYEKIGYVINNREV